MRLCCALLGLCLLSTACGSSSSTAPTPTPTPAGPTLQSVALSAAFTSLKLKGQTTPILATGTFSNGSTQNVTATCTNWQSDNVTVLTVNSAGIMTAQGSGSSTVTTTCQGVFARGLATLTLLPEQLFTLSGTGNTVFDLPTYLTRIHITGRLIASSSSNFIVKIAGRLIVNDLLGNAFGTLVSDGTYLTSGGAVEITNSTNVSWTFTEVR